MFSETRYALNGDLRVAYRTTREGPRDLVFVPNWLTCCEILPDLPSFQGWAAPPTLEQWADSVTAVLDDLGSSGAVLFTEAGAFATAALFAATHPSRTIALIVLDGYADAGGTALVRDEVQAAGMAAMWGTGKLQHVVNPDMPWNEEIRATWARMERLAASPKTLALVLPLVTEVDVRAVLPTIRVPTLVVQHAEDAIIPPAKGRYIAEHTGARHGALHRHGGLDAQSRRDRRPGLACIA
jgi:pimeloyl-ACP methyl ester carboxylesterase